MRGAASLLRHAVTGVILGLGLGMSVVAQTADRPATSQILTIDTERLLTESAAGQAIDAELADKSAQLAAENRRIESELTVEERDLTDRRGTLTPEAFRAAAAAFDDKVQTIREEQDAKLRALQEEANQARRAIRAAADPVLVSIMQDAGAVIIMEKSSVLASLQAIDITAIAIARLDQAMKPDTVINGFDTGTPVPETGTPAPDAGVTPGSDTGTAPASGN